MSEVKDTKQGLSRRDFLKVSGLVGAAVQVAGVAGAARAAGRATTAIPAGRAGKVTSRLSTVRRTNLKGQPTSRSARSNALAVIPTWFSTGPVSSIWLWLAAGLRTAGVDALGEPLATWYKEHPGQLELDIERETVVMPNAAQDHAKYDDYFALADAYANGWERSSTSTQWNRPNLRKFPIST